MPSIGCALPLLAVVAAAPEERLADGDGTEVAPVLLLDDLAVARPGRQCDVNLGVALAGVRASDVNATSLLGHHEPFVGRVGYRLVAN